MRPTNNKNNNNNNNNNNWNTSIVQQHHNTRLYHHTKKPTRHPINTARPHCNNTKKAQHNIPHHDPALPIQPHKPPPLFPPLSTIITTQNHYQYYHTHHPTPTSQHQTPSHHYHQHTPPHRVLPHHHKPPTNATKRSGWERKSEYISSRDLFSKMKVGRVTFVKSIPVALFMLVKEVVVMKFLNVIVI